MIIITRLKEKALTMKNDLPALYLAWHHPVIPRKAKWLLALTVAYALSPLDLIPDFIPLLGQLDDLIILPLLTAFAIKSIPNEILEECRAMAASAPAKMKKNWLAGSIIIMIWLVLLALLFRWLYMRYENTV